MFNLLDLIKPLFDGVFRSFVLPRIAHGKLLCTDGYSRFVRGTIRTEKARRTPSDTTPSGESVILP